MGRRFGVIRYFRGEYSFLSNFFIRSIEIDGVVYSPVEHYFQSMKTNNNEEKLGIICARSPKDAKRLGRLCTLRKDWESVKFAVMEKGIYSKFYQHKDLREKLFATGDMLLEEGNFWNDKYWGVVNGVGENNLGKILMNVREQLNNDRAGYCS